MNFEKVIQQVIGTLEEAGIRYALIGGFAMALRGVQRATLDLDFILMMEDMEKADAILHRFGYVRAFHSENVSHYQSDDQEWGRIDILHAFRGPTLSMLERAEFLNITPELQLRVVQVEDIIGLKIQALCNDPKRAEDDWYDIRAMIRSSAEQDRELDWELIEEYLSLFNMAERLEELRRCYGEAE